MWGEALGGAATGAGIGTAFGPGLGTGIGAGIGLIGGIIGAGEKKKQRQREANLRAAEIEAAPYLAQGGVSPMVSTQVSPEESQWGKALQGIGAGASQFQNYKNAENANSMNAAQMENLKAQTDMYNRQSPWALMSQQLPAQNMYLRG